MKWPLELTLVRHGQSAYNVLRAQKEADPEYQRFKELFKRDPNGEATRELALAIKAKFALKTGDHKTPLTDEGHHQAYVTGTGLRHRITLPDVVIYSPYVRTEETLEGLCRGWPELRKVKHVEDDRIREQEHGLSVIYCDWRVFETLHPEQRELRKVQGPYYYQYPQGESVVMVRDRVRSIQTTLIREYKGKCVLLVTHHLTILSTRANIERLTPKQFIELDDKNPPINLGATHYRCNPDAGTDGKLELAFYNKKLY